MKTFDLKKNVFKGIVHGLLVFVVAKGASSFNNCGHGGSSFSLETIVKNEDVLSSTYHCTITTTHLPLGGGTDPHKAKDHHIYVF